MDPRCVATLLALSLPCLAQTTWVVNSSGGGNFLAIQPAIAAASPGDRVVVQGAGPYAAFVLDKGVDVEAVAGATCVTIEVVGVPAGQSARVAGFGVAVDSSNVVIAGTSILGGVSVPGTPSVGNSGVAGVLLDNGANVTLRGVSSTGSPASGGTIAGGDGGDALNVVDGALTLTGSAPLFGVIALNAAGNGSFVVAIPNAPAAAKQNIFVQGLADVSGSLVLTAPALSRTQ